MRWKKWAKPRLEAMEDRMVPTTLIWDGPANGN